MACRDWSSRGAGAVTGFQHRCNECNVPELYENRHCAGGEPITYAPPDRPLIRDQWYAAVLAKGPIASRPGDTLGLLALKGRVSPDLAVDERLRLALGQDIAVQRRETVFEINYTVRLANWLHITSGAQKIVHPAADPTRRNAKVLDLKTVLNF